MVIWRQTQSKQSSEEVKKPVMQYHLHFIHLFLRQVRTILYFFRTELSLNANSASPSEDLSEKVCRPRLSENLLMNN